MNRKSWLLGGLALLLGLSLAYAWWATPRQERVTTKPAARPRALAKSSAGTETVKTSAPRVRLDILEGPGASFSEPSRDIFRLTTNASVSARPEPEPVVETVSFPPPPPLSSVAGDAAAASAAARFAYLGGLEKDGVKKIFLGVNGEIFIVQPGETFGPTGEFQVEEVTRDKLVVRQDGRPLTLPLADTSQQTASLSSRNNRPSTEREAPLVPGRSPVFPQPLDNAEEVDEADFEMVEESPPDAEPPPRPFSPKSEEKPPEPTEESMSTLQLRSTIQ
ncbi:MAG: hypothetical protein RBT64_05290 [Trichloromonas sp.]|jgi:hypothetical protein|nr:hypothetical protein [Trichloromonas sp.]